MKRDKIFYWVFTGLLCAAITASATAYLVQFDVVSEIIVSLGYPAYLPYVLAVAKYLAVVAILTKQSKLLKSWAYAGLFFDFTLATLAHVMVGDGEAFGSLMALGLWAGSFYFDQKLFGGETKVAAN